MGHPEDDAASLSVFGGDASQRARLSADCAEAVEWPREPPGEDPDEPAEACAAARGGACLACGARPRAPKRCARCRVARFCGPACQRAAWPAHAPRCRAYADLREAANPAWPGWFPLLCAGLLNLRAAAPRVADAADAALAALAAAGVAGVGVEAALIGHARARERGGRGQCVMVAVTHDGGRVPLAHYALVDPYGAAADVAPDAKDASGTPLAVANARVAIAAFCARVERAGLAVTAVAVGTGLQDLSLGA